jgi:hypothetical protein
MMGESAAYALQVKHESFGEIKVFSEAHWKNLKHI